MVFLKRRQPRLLLDILENINCMLDIKIICCDGSFMWSRLLLSCLSPCMRIILKQAKENDAFILDGGIKEKIAQDALVNLLKLNPEWHEEYEGVYELFCVPVTKEVGSNACFDHVLKLEESEENIDCFDTLDEQILESDNSKFDEEDKPCDSNLLMHNGEVVKTEGNGYDKQENNHCIELKGEFLGTLKNINSKVIKRKRKREKSEFEKETVWVKDPSPDRFVDGKQVKYVCVTQENIETGPPYHCIGCDYKSNLIVNVKKHYRIHSNEKPFGCKVCGKKFSTSTTVSSHWNNHHNENRKKEFSCDVCGLLFASEVLLIRHRVVHSGETFVCNICGKEFGSPWGRDGHEMRHKEEAVACPICGKKFPNKRSAERHQVRHDGSRNYECDVCNKKCKTEGDLRNHKRVIHSDAGNFECSVCGKVFKQKHYRDNHVKIVHEKSTRFQCLLCPQVLSTKQHYKRHSLRCHDGQMIPVSNRVK